MKNEIKQQADLIMSQFFDYTNGVRVLFLIHRSKEGAEHSNNDHVKKIITKNSSEFRLALYELLTNKNESELPYRIYSSVNARNIDKAIMKFKHEQLDADYYDIESRNNFYYDVKNRFISCLMAPSSAVDKKFLIDVDSEKEREECLKIMVDSGLDYTPMFWYKTKNGWHLIIKPFNPSLFGGYASKINKDGLLLLDY